MIPEDVLRPDDTKALDFATLTWKNGRSISGFVPGGFSLQAVKSAVEKHGGHLLELPIRDRNLPLLRTIVEAFGAKVRGVLPTVPKIALGMM